MPWLAAQIFRRYQDRRARQRAARSSAAPAVLHPALGLGGRSIELSIASGVTPDPGAFELAAEQLHVHMGLQDHSGGDLLQSAQWLRDLWPFNASVPGLARLNNDLEELRRRQVVGYR